MYACMVNVHYQELIFGEYTCRYFVICHGDLYNSVEHSCTAVIYFISNASASCRDRSNCCGSIFVAILSIFVVIIITAIISIYFYSKPNLYSLHEYA